jgi:hypothetical protein
LRHTKTDLEGCEKIFEVTRNHRSRNGAFLDLRKFGRCCGPDAPLVSVKSAWGYPLVAYGCLGMEIDLEPFDEI